MNIEEHRDKVRLMKAPKGAELARAAFRGAGRAYRAGGEWARARRGATCWAGNRGDTRASRSPDILGAAAEEARRIAADVVRVELPEHPKLVWYDRAVFHFLADPEARVR